ncbi:hypothetical protein P879_10820 [Paragonimus westermani]|uniref:Uncharacterized protein n=1 Tax=Paragonimus westermani TaxID=34504 RepID=A0A8T0D8V3_9TREM|nr:hypothetical protein P879_10820 [Paragonimus westermani]
MLAITVCTVFLNRTCSLIFLRCNPIDPNFSGTSTHFPSACFPQNPNVDGVTNKETSQPPANGTASVSEFHAFVGGSTPSNSTGSQMVNGSSTVAGAVASGGSNSPDTVPLVAPAESSKDVSLIDL